jgi:hypothetical protein
MNCTVFHGASRLVPPTGSFVPVNTFIMLSVQMHIHGNI